MGNEDMNKLMKGGGGTSLKTKLILTIALVVLAAAVVATVFNIFESNAPFIQECNLTEEKINIGIIVRSQEEALTVLGNYTAVEGLVFNEYPIDYKCDSLQYYFENKETQERYYVCRNGYFIKVTQKDCGYGFNLSVASDIEQAITSRK